MIVTLPHPRKIGTTYTVDTDKPQLIEMSELFSVLRRREHARAVARVALHRLLCAFHVHDLEELADRLDSIAAELRSAKKRMLAEDESTIELLTATRSFEVAA